MAYITPNSDIKLCQGVPLDKDYNHTLFHYTPYVQDQAFAQYVKYTLNNLTYQRINKNTIRVGKIADDLYNCNYMLFRNTSYGNKWFYAFIDEVNYINDECSEIVYTIDVMQTWYFDYDMGECFVEREHTETDVIGENLVPEEVELGDLIPEKTWQYMYPDDTESPSIMYHLIVFYVPNNNAKAISGEHIGAAGYTVYDLDFVKDPNTGKYYTGEIVDGVYMGCRFWDVPMVVSDATSAEITMRNIDNLIATILGNDVKGQIVNIVQVPTQIFNEWIVSHGSDYVVPQEIVTNVTSQQSTLFFNSNHTLSFTPKNKKLYTYPYKNIVMSNNCGQTATLKWECFTDPMECTFNVSGVPIPSPEVMCYPTNYRGLLKDYESGIVINDFPQPPWSEDSFAKWWSQNKDAYITSLVSSAIMFIGLAAATAGTGGAAAPALGAAIGGKVATGVKLAAGAKVASSITQMKQAKNTPDQISGQVNVSTLRTVQKRVGFKFYDMGVELDKAKTIDNYFTMFGYAIKKVKIPNVRDNNVTKRPHWNYIKTAGCILHSQTSGSYGLPADAEDQIAQIYDRGITFWTSMSEIGNYSLNNSPVVP